MEETCSLPETKPLDTKVLDDLLLTKTGRKYHKEYRTFTNWCDQNNVNLVTENVILSYFETTGHSKKSSTMWAKYSMLKTCLNINKSIDISKFSKLTAFLKKKSEEYVPRKSKTLKIEHINKFLLEAHDRHYLAMKNVLIMGYSGACRREELTLLRTSDVQFKTGTVFVSIPKVKNNIARVFTITDPTWIELILKYYRLRPPRTPHHRYFVTYREGKCLTTPIGINTMGQMPRSIATFLNLPNPGEYTGNCFRRTSVSEQGNRRGDIITVKKHGGWNTSAVGEGFETSWKKELDVSQIFSKNCATTSSQSPSSENSKCSVNKHAEKTIQDAVMKYLNEITSRESTTTTKLTNGTTTQIIVEILKPRTTGKKPVHYSNNDISKMNKTVATSQPATITQQPIKTETQLHGIDSLYDFCIGIYNTTKKMPKHVQSKVREKISALLKDEEEQLIKNDNVQYGSSSTSSVENSPFILSDNFVAIKTEIPETLSESCFSTDSEVFDTFVEKYEPV